MTGQQSQSTKREKHFSRHINMTKGRHLSLQSLAAAVPEPNSKYKISQIHQKFYKQNSENLFHSFVRIGT